MNQIQLILKHGREKKGIKNYEVAFKSTFSYYVRYKIRKKIIYVKNYFKQIKKVIKDKLNKSGIEKDLKKHSNYLAKSKEIWAMINEDLGISDIVENKLISQVGKFEKALIVKFPELTKDNVIEIIQSIVGKINSSKR